MGVKFVTPKEGDAVAVVARSIEAKVEEELEESAASAGAESAEPAGVPEASSAVGTGESENAEVDATIETDDASE
jgi:DNA gyrase subunit A